MVALFRILTHLSLLEWLVMIAVIGWFVRRPRSVDATQRAPAPSWVLNICVGLTVIGIVGGAIWQIRWLSLIGFAAAVLGIALVVRSMMQRIQHKIARLFSRKKA